MNILFIITGLGVGGAETQLESLTRQFLKSGFKLRIISLVNLHQVTFNEDIKIDFLDLSINPATWFISLVRALKIVNSFNPDIIHAHMFHANIFSRILKLFNFKIPLINSAHSVNEGGNFRMFLYRATDFLANHCTQVSQMALDHFCSVKAFSKSKSSVLYNGIDPAKFYFENEKRKFYRNKLLGNSTNTFLYISIGRLVSVKNHQSLIYAFSLLDKKLQENSKLIIIGQGPLRLELVNLVRTLQLDEFIEFVDHTSNVENYLNAADTFVLPSLFEGFPLSVVESLFCHCPVICSNKGGMVEIFDKNFNYIFSPEDSNHLVDLLIKIRSDARHIRQTLAENHNDLVSRFSIEQISNMWIALYKDQT